MQLVVNRSLAQFFHIARRACVCHSVCLLFKNLFRAA